MMRSILRQVLLSAVMLATAILVVASGVAANAAASTSKSPVAAEVPCAAGTLVQTTTGPVCGIVANGDSEWLGIPYAAPQSGVCAGLPRSRTRPGAQRCPPPPSAVAACKGATPRKGARTASTSMSGHHRGPRPHPASQ